MSNNEEKTVEQLKEFKAKVEKMTAGPTRDKMLKDLERKIESKSVKK